MSNIINARISHDSKTQLVTEPLYQYDYGQILDLSAINGLPTVFETHFCNKGDDTATVSIGQNGQVEIPDAYLQTGKYVYAYVYLHTGDADGETEYKTVLPVIARQNYSHEEPTPVQQSEIEQLVSALNSGVESAENAQRGAEEARHDALVAQDAAEAAQQSAEEAADRAEQAERNADGYAQDAERYAQQAAASEVSASNEAEAAGQSAEAAANSASDAQAAASSAEAAKNTILGMNATATTLPAGSEATASYSDGTLTLGIPRGGKGDKGDTGATGQNGADGYSPTVSVTAISGGHRITVEDKDGVESFDVLDGQDGEDGAPGDDHAGKYALKYAEALNSASPIPIDAEWETGGMSSYGANQNTIKYRARSVGRVQYSQACVLEAADGYQFTVEWRDANGTHVSVSAWRSFFTLQPEYNYRICVRAYPEDTSITADPELFGAAISIRNQVPERKSVTYDYDHLEYRAIAHRGAEQIAPENTAPAYRLAKQMGWDFAETDIGWTSDGVPCCLHNATINNVARNTDGSQLSETIYLRDITLAQAQEYDFTEGKAGFEGTKILTFEDFLKLCKAIKLYPYIELKNQVSPTTAEVQGLIDLVHQYGMGRAVTWISGNLNLINTVVSYDQCARVLYVVSSFGETSGSAIEAYKTGYNRVGIDVLSSAVAGNEQYIANVRARGVDMEVYGETTGATVKDPRIEGVTSSDVPYTKTIYADRMGSPMPENVPSGGSAGQVLAKASETDYDMAWVNQSGGGGGGTSDYDQLSNRPQINGTTLTGNKTAAQLGLAAASDIPVVPVQSVNGQTGAVVLGAEDVGALPSTTSIPSNVSDLTNDSGFVNASGAAAAAPVQSVNGQTGAVTVAVPTKTSDLTNDSGFLTSAPVSSVNGQTGAVSLTIPSTAADVGAIAAPSSPASGAFLVWDGSAWTAQTLATWQASSY